MNIQQAKLEITRTYRAYIRRNPDGTHRIPPEKQRPVLLIGPPGIGKTAIMRQIADETGCGLVAYAMTHHTRQSAIGLPFISQREYGGRMFSVTEYTMSEIVAAIYDTMKRTGKQSGILFLDEINCVSETLSPVMLQLLQNKTFGNVSLPEDWIIVAAGNPPEYNRSVRELDMVTLDRVKHIDVEADLSIWLRYAIEQGVHPAIRTYLSLCPDHFYKIKETDRGQMFVTARGWEDLSLMLAAYEEDGIDLGPEWFLQYLQYDEIARSFGLYYDLFRRFSARLTDDATLHDLLLADPEGLSACASTECLAIASTLFHGIETEAARLWEEGLRLDRRKALLSLMPPAAPEETAREFFSEKRRALEIKASHGVLKPREELRETAALDRLEADVNAWRTCGNTDFFDYERARLEEDRTGLEAAARTVAASVEKAYHLLEKCPQGRSALLYLTNDLTASKPCEAILKAHTVEAYERYRRELEM